ncbi:MAG: hypothetical protein ACOC1G_01095 [Phycisphaeraceae bacterium]
MWMSFADQDAPGAGADGEPDTKKAAAGPAAGGGNAATPPGGPGKGGPPDSPLGGGENERSVGDEINATLMGLIPWGISLLLHVGLLLLAFFIAWSAAVEPDDDPPVTPSLSYTETPQMMEMQETQVEQVQQRSAAQTQVQVSQPAVSTAPAGAGAELAAEVAPPASASNDYEGEEAGENEVKFMGSRGNARTVAFLIDASGSLIDTLPHVVRYLQEITLPQLSPKQRFSIIFFQGGNVIEVPPSGLTVASQDNKQQAIRWLTNNPIDASFGTDPTIAIKRALQYKPQLLFILSDNLTNAGAGPYEIPQWKLIQQIAEQNVGNTKIKTIQFIYPDPLDSVPGREGTMRRIAREFGAGPNGDPNEWYQFVDAEVLGLE